MKSEDNDKMDVLNDSDNEDKGKNKDLIETDTENSSSQWNKIPTVSTSSSSSKKHSSTTKLDRFQKLQAKVTNDPWDCESWTNLLNEAQQKGNPTVIRETYDQFLKQFPTSLEAWKEYIKWEKGNPLKLKEDLMIKRVTYAYKQALLTLRFFPEIWYDYSIYLTESGKTEESIFILKTASEILPNSLLINFALAEAHELKLKTPAESSPSFVNPKQIYETLIKNLENEIDKVDARYNTKKTRLLALVSTLNSPNAADPMDNDNDEQGKQNEKIKEKEKEIKEIEKERNEKVKELKQRLGLAWIVFMRFSRRSE
ncbi:hypothetical protein PIROE2DRAFT_58844, partial [Piromyces sp. E2]